MANLDPEINLFSLSPPSPAILPENKYYDGSRIL